MRPREKREGEGEVKSWEWEDGIRSSPLWTQLSATRGRWQVEVMLLLSPSPSPWLHPMIVPRSLDIGERSLQGPLAIRLPPIPTHNL